MASDAEFTEVVKFQAEGGESVQRTVADLSAEIEKARRAQELFTDALSDPAYRKSLIELDALTRKNREYAAELVKQQRLTDRPTLVATSALAAARERVRLDREAAEQAAKKASYDRQARIEQLRGGGGLTDARERIRLARAERVERDLIHRNDLAAMYGRFGGRLVGLAEGRPASLTLGGATAGAGLVAATATAGFSGTVESERLSREATLLKRSVAGAFVPAIEMATAGVKRLTRASDSLSAGQQQAIAATTIAVIGLKAASIASNRLFGVGLVEAAVAAGSFGGRALSGAFGSTAGAAGGQVAGSVAGKALAGAGGAAGGAAATAGASGGMLAAAGPFAVAAGLTLGYGKTLYDTGDYYRHMREQGRSRFPSAAFAFGGSLWDNLVGIPNFFGAGLPTVDEKILKKKPSERTDVTLNQSGFGELGGSYDRFTLAAGMVDESFQRNIERVANATERVADAVDRNDVPRKQ